MKTAVCVVTLLYGLLNVLASLTQMKDKARRIPTCTMLAGGMLLTAASVMGFCRVLWAAAPAAAGALAVCIAAIVNGRQNGQIHVLHHIVRAALSCLLIAGLALC